MPGDYRRFRYFRRSGHACSGQHRALAWLSVDDEQRVKEIRFEGNSEFRKVEYRYNPLGRRTYKILWRYGEKYPETIRFDWQGLQLAGEQSDREPDHYVQYVNTEGSYEPLARVDSVFDDCEIYWYHTELNGLPEWVTRPDRLARAVQHLGQNGARAQRAAVAGTAESALPGTVSRPRKRPALQPVPLLRPGTRALHADGPDRVSGRDKYLFLRG